MAITSRGWHVTATAGVFSAATMAGRLLGLDADGLGTHGAWPPPNRPGLSAISAAWQSRFRRATRRPPDFSAAHLAARGFKAGEDILDGAGGFIELYGDGHLDPDSLEPGKPWEIAEPGIYVKRWPCCYANHRPLAGVFELMQRHKIRHGDSRRGSLRISARRRQGACPPQPANRHRSKVQYRILRGRRHPGWRGDARQFFR